MLQCYRPYVGQLETQLKAKLASQAKEKRLNDLNLLFQDCAKERPQPVDTLVHSHEAGVDAVCLDTNQITVTDAKGFEIGRPLISHGQPFVINAIEENRVSLSNAQGLEVGALVRQEKVVASDAAILAEFEQVWQGRWNRLTHLHPDKWDDVVSFVREAFTPRTWEFPQWSVDDFLRCVQHKPARAATGPDGVSRADLLALPPAAVQHIVDLLQQVESPEGRWPPQLAVGMVSGLDKGKGAADVDAFRPVTVYPIIYRVWSSCRAKQAMNQLVKDLPSSIKGGVPNCQARSVWFELAQLIEISQIQQASWQGIALDIRRCFNALPRWPIWTILDQLGFPSHILRPWATYLAQQVRRFRVRGSVGNPLGSCTGFPEGCALSVFSMALIDWLVDLWLAKLTQCCLRFVSFVDDWQLLFPRSQDIDQVWQATTFITDALDLQLDLTKSYAWATQQADRQALRSSQVGVVLAARDLGAHQNYCRRAGNKTLIDRVTAMAVTWKLLRASASPYRLKAIALVQLAWPRALHGVSIVKVGANHFHSLRTGALRGLRAARVGSNPMLHLSTIGISADPEAWSILQTLRDCRELGGSEQLQTVLGWIGSGDVDIPNNGPSAVLRSRLSRLGWCVLGDGTVRDKFGTFNPMQLHWDALRFRVQLAWPAVMATEVHHRKTMQGIQFADLNALMQSLRQYGQADLVYLRCALDGTLYQDIGKAKENRGSCSTCKYCNGTDGFYHRNWVCPAFQSARCNFAWPELVQTLPLCLSCHGWPIQTWANFQLLKWFDEIPITSKVVKWPSVPRSTPVELFVDGACAFPQSASLRYAAWAISWASSGVGFLDHQIVMGDHLSGMNQSSFRAELTAMVNAFEMALHIPNKVRIWSDNLAVVRVARRVLQRLRFGNNKSHSDLVIRMQRAAEDFLEGHVTIVKVTSHCAQDKAVDDAESWAFWQNALVDEAAGAINSRRQSQFWAIWTDAKAATEFQAKLLHQVQAVILAVGRKERSFNTKLVSPTTNEASGDAIVETPPVTWAVPQSLDRKYRRENMEQIHAWWQSVGVQSLTVGARSVWVSGLQLYLDFRLSTRYEGILSPKFGKWYISAVEAPEGTKLGIGSRSTMFLRPLVAYWKANKCIISSRLLRPSSSCLDFWCMSYLLDWPRQRLARVDELMFMLHGRQVVKPRELDQYVSLPDTFEFP